jgi:23S rRNA (cytidine1920-2'-O)/16S rRNA (cytidine1409-2'-O)-methyltransferase
LQKALRYFGVDPIGKVCIDCGASTGGFTDCLLKGGAVKVYAVDVGYGQLAWSIRTDPRVVTLERTNVRYVTREQIPEPIDLAVIDVSFISLKLVLPVVRHLLKNEGHVISLIKPQFEATRQQVGKKGIVKDGAVHEEVLKKYIENAENAGFFVQGITYAPIGGSENKKNIEFLGYLSCSGTSKPVDTSAVVKNAHEALGG